MDPLPDRAPPPSVPVRKSALAFFGVLLVLWVPGALAQGATLPWGLAWTELFGFLLSALIATAGSNLRPGPYLRLGPVRPAALAVGALAGAAGYLVAGSILSLTQRLLPGRISDLFDPLRLFEGPRSEQLALAAVAIFLAPACEEIAFRGYVQTTLGLRRGPAAAVMGAAVLFALLHMNPVLFPALVVLGAIFGWLAWRAGSIWPAVVAHAVNNAISSALALAGPVAQAEPPPLSVIGAAMALGGGALLAIGAIYRTLTPDPPPLSGAVALRDGGDASTRFSPARVPSGLAVATFAGAALLAALLAAGPVAGRLHGR
ncbi:MAG TPA: type II CAAX endopeptidase family protein [Anaeromyxobacter sp.]